MNDEQRCDIPVGLSLILDEETRFLRAIVEPVCGHEQREPLNARRMKTVLNAAGFGDYHLFDEGLTALMRDYPHAAELRTFDIAECRDAQVSVTVAKDRTAAWLTALPAYGGEPLTRALLDEALNRAGVVSGLLEEVLDEVLREGVADSVVVARGPPAEDGQDSRFESLLPDARDRRPRIDASGVADYTDLGDVTTVRPGQALMRRHPPTPGVDGVNVFGEVLHAKPGKEIPFSNGLEGVEPDVDDPDLLRAARVGLPVVVDGGVRVEQVLVLDSVDLSSGNVNFEGTVTIQGDVRAGLKVEAAGDILVGGTVEAAHLHAAGDIRVTGGIIGDASAVSVGRGGEEPALIRAGGTVTARFCEFGRIEAETVVIGEFMSHSRVTAVSVTVGRQGARKGQLIGGCTRALSCLEVMHLGSPGDVATVVEVGMDQQLRTRLQSVEGQLSDLCRKVEELQKIAGERASVTAGGTPQAGLLEKVSRAVAQLGDEIAKLEREREEIAARLEQAERACVKATRRVYGGVQVRIGDRLHRVDEECAGGLFRLEDGTVILDHSG